MKKQVQQTNNLFRDGKIASRNKVPLLLIFSQTDCPFCERLKEEVINPMLLSGEYTHRAMIREFMIDDDDPVTDFDGKHTDSMSVFMRYGLFVTPSVLFLGGQGKELAERQIGINTVDFYSYYLDRSIDQALKKIQGRR